MVDDASDECALPYVMVSAGLGGSLIDLAEAERSSLSKRLLQRGAVLLRGFQAKGIDDFRRFAETFAQSPLLEYSERSSPRTSLNGPNGTVYTSTDYPQDQTIFLHNENSYQSTWPRTLYFYCIQPPSTLGATPLADIRSVCASIDPAVREEFRRRGWSVVRNFHSRVGIPWTDVFGTDDRAIVADHCHKNRIRHQWINTGQLRTTATRSAIHVHPDTGEEVWFNHIAFFHYTTLPEEVREGLEFLFSEEDLPTNTYYGDGGTIPAEVVAHLRDCYQRYTTRFDWQTGDVLLVDNMLAAHGREPYTGLRQIAVAMTTLHTDG
jgi:alpha-ketoglutarate-dependent taurine dioxygenase